MRDFLNAILAFIDSESLTDSEYASLPTLTLDYTAAVYNALKAVLTARETVSGQLNKLLSYFVAKGVDISTTGAAVDPASQILIGSPL